MGQALPVLKVPVINVAAWNIRGLNQLPKQMEVRSLIRENHISLCAILESRVAVKTLKKVCSKVFGSWAWTSNGKLCNHGTRIIFGWDHNALDVMVINQSTQTVHCQVTCRSSKISFFCSFIYAANNHYVRRDLWNELIMHKRFVANNP